MTPRSRYAAHSHRVKDNPRIWPGFAHDYGVDAVTRWMHVQKDERTTRHYSPDRPIVPVNIVEDLEGDYLGWLPSGHADQVRLVQHHRLFNMQFPYGYEAEADAGKGEAIRVRIDDVK